MANQQHLAVLQQGVETWNRWREKRQELEHWESFHIVHDVPLAKKYPHSVDLSGANLEKSDWSRINLQGANLRGVRFIRADLREANLSHADLEGALFDQANLEDADLSHANLAHASMADANLWRVNLREADLSHASFLHTFLAEADLWRAELIVTDFTWAILHKANLQEASAWHTIFGDVDLSDVKGLETLHHWRPSVIDIRTLARSSGRIPETFLRDAGIDPDILPALLALFRPYHGHETQWYSEIAPVPPLVDHGTFPRGSSACDRNGRV